jgi:hypothetical protein
MTIEELLAMPSLDTISDKKLEEHLAKYFPYTRPLGVKPHTEVMAEKLAKLMGVEAEPEKKPVTLTRRVR